jgi:transposase
MSISWNREDPETVPSDDPGTQPGGCMRMLFGIGTSRSLQGMIRAALACFMAYKTRWAALQTAWVAPCRMLRRFHCHFRSRTLKFQNGEMPTEIAISSTGC